MYVVTVNIVVKEAYLEDFALIMAKQAQNSLAREKDCHYFDVCLDPSDPRRYFLYEVYTNEKAFEEHMKTDHYIDFTGKIKDLLVSKEKQTWEKTPN